MYKEEDKAGEALNKALDLGITYVDTAYGYGNGKSETWVGNTLKGRRKNIWLATKVQDRTADGAMRIIEGSLKRLQTDHLDLIHIHSLQNADDLGEIESDKGVLKTLYKLREQKVTRFIGVTSHTDPRTLKTALERHDFDCTQMALNAALAGMSNGKSGMVINRELKDSFEHIALPVALKKKMGVTAMKIFAQEGLVGAAPVNKLLYYSLSLPVASAILGMPKLEYLDENVQVARAYTTMPRGEMDELSGKLSKQYKAELDRRFENHIDA